MIPVADPKAQFLAHRAGIEEAMRRVLEKGRYILGEEVRAFESEFAAYVGVGDAVGVGSGTDALHLAVRALGLGPGDEVVTVAHTAVATVAAIELAGAAPVMVDVDPETFTLDPAKLDAAVGPRTRAVIAVHLYGRPAALDEILAVAGRRGLRVIEDCAQAHGARHRGRRVGSFGDLAAFSFYPTKNLGAIGDGGMVVGADRATVERVRLLREYGWEERYVSRFAGTNSRLDELQAAVLRVKLRTLDADNASRARLARRYDEAFAGLPLRTPPAADGHAYHLYVVRTVEREALMKALHDRGVGTLVHYPVPVHLQAAYRDRLRGADRLAETERAAREVLSLPLYPELPESDQDRVIEAVRSFFARPTA